MIFQSFTNIDQIYFSSNSSILKDAYEIVFVYISIKNV